MNSSSTDRLLARLNNGDADAAGELFQAFEPYLRMVVHRRISHALRAKFDSADIVQSIWADIIDGLHRSHWTFENIDQFRAFLVKMTYHRYVDRVRKHRGALQHELTMSPHAVEMLAPRESARVGETLDADELWGQMLDVCPPGRSDVLFLRREGASLDEIAAHTGLHKGSVRRILHHIGRLLARLRAAQSPL